MCEKFAGVLRETEDGYEFRYTDTYTASKDSIPLSLTLPLSNTKYTSRVMFPFFDGLIPEGWLLMVAEKSWKINPRDRMGLLLVCCKDCIGAVSIEEDAR